LNKLYDDKIRYKAKTFDVFESKFRIFYDSCYKVGILPAYQYYAFSIIFADRAKDYYYRRILVPGNNEPLALDVIVATVKGHFENQE